MMRSPKLPPPSPPPPPPRPIPTETAPNVRQAMVEDARKNRKRTGRDATLLSGSLGDGNYAGPPTERRTLLG